MTGGPGDDEVAALLRGVRRVAVLGVSDRFTRPSFRLAAHLLDRTGWDVDLVNPHVDETLNRAVLPTLALLSAPPDLVVVYRSPVVLDAAVDEIVAAGAGAVWFPAGTDDGLGSTTAVPPPGRARPAYERAATAPRAPSGAGSGPAASPGGDTAERVGELVARAAERARTAGLVAVAGRDLKTEHVRWCR